MHQCKPLIGIELLKHVTDIGMVQRLHDERQVVGAPRSQEGAQPLQPERTDPAVRIAEHVDVIAGLGAGLGIKFVAHREPFSCPGGFRGKTSM
jgi:hypothetical protein